MVIGVVRQKIFVTKFYSPRYKIFIGCQDFKIFALVFELWYIINN